MIPCNSLKKRTSIITITLVMVFLSACSATSGGSYAVGPQSISNQTTSSGTQSAASTELSVLIPVFQPNIPSDSADFEKLGVWPELRRAEANRFSVQLRNAVADTRSFGAVRISPDDSATGHLYVIGEIIKSNGEDITLGIVVTDISGKRLLNQNYTHRVSEYSMEDPRQDYSRQHCPT